MTAAPLASAPLLDLNDGGRIPQVGLGVYKVPARQTADVVATALASGYRHIDTAALYQNERAVGEGVRRSGVPRGDVFVTSKVWNSDHGYDSTLRAFDATMDELGFDYLDLYLIHWPAPRQDRYVDTWRALERLSDEGRVKSIGVSNFHQHHIERLLAETDVVPVVNQVELHPWLPQAETRAFNARHGIRTEAWSPFARGRLFGNPTLDAVAHRHGVTVGQVIVRWHVQLGNIVLPKSVTPERIRSNLDVFGFELGQDDMTAIATLESGERTGSDPDDLD
ncbi:aldo/keto reductase [Okibacterium endophyticum]